MQSFPYDSTRKMSFLEQASRSAVTSLEINDALKAVMVIVVNAFEAEAGALLLYSHVTDSLEFAVGVGTKKADVSSNEIAAGKGIAGWVFKNKEPVFSNDVGNDKRFNETVRREIQNPVDNIVAVPLMLREECLGVVEIINRPSQRAFDFNEMQILTTLSHQIALVVENKRLFEKWSQQLFQRNILLELTKAVNSNRSLSDLLTFIVKTGTEMLNAEAGSLLLREGELLRFEVAYGEKEREIKKFTVPLGTGIAGSVARSGKSILINEAGKESGIFKDIDNKTGFNTRNLLCVPLQVRERVIGVLEVLNCRNEEGFNEEDVSLIEGFASQAAVSIERAQLVEKRIHAERLETIGRTVAGLTHCIKNITSVLKLGVYIVDNAFKDKDMEAIRGGWHITKSGCERITELVLDMLTLSKKREPEYEDCDPCLIAAEVAELIKVKAREKNVEVQTALDKETGIVKVDRKGIFRCLMNLVSNAIDACNDAGGIVRIETFPVREKQSFGFRIVDNGHGIKEADQKKLFNEFFSTKGSKGTGLGLSVTHSIITEHGGNIRCDSQVGKGTTFTVELPLQSQITREAR